MFGPEITIVEGPLPPNAMSLGTAPAGRRASSNGARPSCTRTVDASASSKNKGLQVAPEEAAVATRAVKQSNSASARAVARKAGHIGAKRRKRASNDALHSACNHCCIWSFDRICCIWRFHRHVTRISTAAQGNRSECMIRSCSVV